MPRPPLRDPRKDPRALLGRALKRLRVAAGYTTQAALAARLDGPARTPCRRPRPATSSPPTT
jgi:hypothetical protein